MPDSKISALQALATPAGADLLVVGDVDATTMALSGSDKKITVDSLITFLGGTFATSAALTSGLAGKSDVGHTHPTLYVALGASVDNVLVRFNGTSGQIQGSGIVVSDLDEISGYLGAEVVIAGTSYTLQALDKGKVLKFTAATAVTLTVPADIPARLGCTLLQKGAGQVQVVVTGGLLHHRLGYTRTAGQWALAALYVEDNPGSAPSVALGGDVTS